MKREFHAGNRSRLYEMMKPNSLLAMFAGEEIRKTNDEYYLFFTDRNFLYLTGLDGKESVLLAMKDAEGCVTERVYILPPDARAERWNGRRIQPAEAEEKSGVGDVRYVAAFENDFHMLATSGNYENIYLDLYRASPADIDRPAHKFLRGIQKEYPYLKEVDSLALANKQMDLEAAFRNTFSKSRKKKNRFPKFHFCLLVRFMITKRSGISPAP